MIHYGANVNIADVSGETPLSLAIKGGNFSLDFALFFFREINPIYCRTLNLLQIQAPLKSLNC